MDIVEKLADLYKQAMTEHSHFYVASCIRTAAAEIIRLRSEIVRLNAKMLDRRKKKI